MLAYADTGEAAMIRKLALAALAAAALGGCATDYAYRGGAGDYYYGQPSVQYYDYGYGAPYGSLYGYPGGWNLGIGYGYGGYGYGFPYYGGYYPYYPYYPPYYWYRPPHHHHRPPPEPTGPVTGGRLPPSELRNATPYRQLPSLPREGAQPMLPPGRGQGRVDPPRMSRPAPPMVRDPAAGRGGVSERRPSPPPMVRQAPPMPTMDPPSRKRERIREQER